MNRVLNLIWAYFRAFIIEKNREHFYHPDLWDTDTATLNTIVSAIQSNVLLAEDLELILPGKQTREFLYWKYKGNTRLIIEEMLEAKAVETYELKDSPLGLKWLTKQLNKTRSESDQIGNII
ncbi:hypothetical protein GCM10027098_38490 [Bowmanella dokdonensis]